MTYVNRWILFSLAVGIVVHFVAIDVLRHQPHRSVVTDIVQGTLAGGVLGFFTAQIFARIKATKVNGWITLFPCGVPGNGRLFRAACALTFLGPVNVPQEAMYWTTRKDGAGNGLNGRHDYIMHFPPGGLPPNDAFWSLTMGDAKNRFVTNPINRYSVSDRTGLVPNADGSVDIYIQNRPPADHESNWLPAPAGKFILWAARVCAWRSHSQRRVQGTADCRSEMLTHVEHEHLLITGSFMVMGWFLFIYFWPRTMLYVYKRAILVKGFGDGPIHVNTLHTEPQTLFADPLHPPASASKLATTGVNRDTLITIGWLDLAKGPLVLHVPDMAGRYYSVQFTDPSNNTNFAYVGKRTTGTEAGGYFVSGPRWKGTMPQGIAQISSPNNSVLVIGRVFVESESDLSAAYDLAKQIRLTPLDN